MGEGPPPHGAVVVCAPHTSNFDYVLMLLVGWVHGLTLSFLGKESLFKPPLGWIMPRHRRGAGEPQRSERSGRSDGRRVRPEPRHVPGDSGGRHPQPSGVLEVGLLPHRRAGRRADPARLRGRPDQDQRFRSRVQAQRQRGRYGHRPRVLRRQGRREAPLVPDRSGSRRSWRSKHRPSRIRRSRPQADARAPRHNTAPQNATRQITPVTISRAHAPAAPIR